ncbi:MAG: aa3-type cytochrome c oxidase subunit IV [Sphingopyxis sp.]
MAHQDLGHDISEATETYGGFIALFKWGAIVCIAVTALVLYLIS